MPDITGPLVTLMTDLVGTHGVIAVFLLMVLDGISIPVPSEVVMTFGGFLAGQGRVSMTAIIVAGVMGNVVGSSVAWWVGKAKGRDWALRWHWLHITPARLDSVDRWFDRYGSWAVLLSRFVPLLRTLISIPAGIVRMPFWRFTILSTIGFIPWVTGWAFAGLAVGENWPALQKQLHWIDYGVAIALVVGAVWLLWRWRSRRAAAVKPGA